VSNSTEAKGFAAALSNGNVVQLVKAEGKEYCYGLSTYNAETDTQLNLAFTDEAIKVLYEMIGAMRYNKTINPYAESAPYPVVVALTGD
jgi:hypothetical protein